ncbi:MAG: bifunctional folylpolyglutamate synthase/dihydrofolate synthase [Ignavibacteria bacterium]|nr:bifunctional folylpolyglutamate synthase/dihydrofolate synthase [Ignavibacteria bacterium]
MIAGKFKSYKSAVEYLFALERAGIKYDLTNITKLLRITGNPHLNFKSIHVAGTNGKGSVASILNSALIESGIRTGLYTSPHISDFRERILVNGKFISKKFILDFVNVMHKEIEKIKPSFFEVTTAMAFSYFSKMKTEYAVIETGLGGRLDSTNIITPVLSVITGISLDHTEYLGNSISSITKEKGGIIKKRIPAVAGKLTAVSKKILLEIALEKSTSVLFSDRKKIIKITRRKETGFNFKIEKDETEYFFPVIGDYQTVNIATALCCLKILKDNEGPDVSRQIFKKSLINVVRNSHYKGRFELVSKHPKVITDISHNLQGINNIESNLKYFKFKKAVIIFGMMNDKNYADCIKELKRLKHPVIFTKPDYKRAAEPETLFSITKKDSEKILTQKKHKRSV